MRRPVLAAGIALALLAAVLPLTSSGAAVAPKALPSFYTVPKHWPSKAPGTYIKSQAITVSGLDGTAWRVMYVSQADKGVAVPVTGYLEVPKGTAPAGGWPVVAWSHGTDGMAAICAPSLDIGGSDIPISIMNAFLAKGWAFTASDYQGEGAQGAGPKLLPYIVGASAAEDTINIVRADEHVPGADTSKSWVEWGHSEGGQTAMFVDHIAAAYAPDLNLKGVVAGAPPSQFTYLNAFLETSPYAYYLLMVAFGYNAYYGNKAAPLSDILTKKAEALLPDVKTSCITKIAAAVTPYVEDKDFSALEKADPYTIPAWKKLLNANDPGAFSVKSTVPLLIIQGGDDEQIPVAHPPSSSTRTFARLARSRSAGSIRASRTPG